MESNSKKGLEFPYLTITILVCFFVVYMDATMSRVFNIELLYVLPLLMSFAYKNEYGSFLLATLLTLCMLLVDFFITNTNPENILVNSLITIIMLWVIAFFIHRWKQIKNNLNEINDALECLVLENMQQIEALNSAALVLVTDITGKINYVNKGYLRISKYSEKELIGNNPRIVKSGYHSLSFYQNLWGTIKSGSTWKGELCNKNKEGGTFWVYNTIVPFFNQDGKIVKFIAICFDITQQKQQQELLKTQAIDLKSVNEDLETYSYSVSHDLRAPLRAIEGFSNALKETYENKLDDDGKRWINYIANNARRMDILIKDILNYSKTSRTLLSKREISMEALANECYDNLKGLYKHKKIEFVVGKLPETYGDITMLRQVWSNLISNALKYASNKETIKVSIKGFVNGNESVYIIKDNGIGFDDKYSEKIFGVFQRLHKPEEFEGTGVGLSIVYRIIQKHGGTITAKSTVNNGAEFEFTINNIKIG